MSLQLAPSERITGVARWALIASLAVASLLFIAPFSIFDSLPPTAYYALLGGSAIVFLVAAIAVVATELMRPHPSPQEHLQTRTFLPTPAWALPLFGIFLALCTITFYGFYSLVWNPLAKAPGLTLAEIYRQMKVANEFSAGVIITTGVIALIPLAAVPFVHMACRHIPSYSPLRALGLCATFVWMSLTIIWWGWGFHMGMGLADTFGTHGGDEAPGASIMPLVTTGFFILGLAGLVTPRQPPQIRPPHPHIPPATS